MPDAPADPAVDLPRYLWTAVGRSIKEGPVRTAVPVGEPKQPQRKMD